MATPQHRSPAQDASGPDPRLAQRLRRRVDETAAELEARPGSRRRTRVAKAAGASSLSAGVPRTAEQRALRVVFRHFGHVYREHRQQTAASIFPPLKNAATAFRKAPSFGSLLPVAVLMDELALDW